MPVAAWIALASVVFGMSMQAAVFAFFVGRLTERVATLEREAKREAGLSDKVTRLEVQMENAIKEMESVNRTLQGVNRQLATIATNKLGFHLEGS